MSRTALPSERARLFSFTRADASLTSRAYPIRQDRHGLVARGSLAARVCQCKVHARGASPFRSRIADGRNARVTTACDVRSISINGQQETAKSRDVYNCSRRDKIVNEHPVNTVNEQREAISIRAEKEFNLIEKYSTEILISRPACYTVDCTIR